MPAIIVEFPGSGCPPRAAIAAAIQRLIGLRDAKEAPSVRKVAAAIVELMISGRPVKGLVDETTYQLIDALDAKDRATADCEREPGDNDDAA